MANALDKKGNILNRIHKARGKVKRKCRIKKSDVLSKPDYNNVTDPALRDMLGLDTDPAAPAPPSKPIRRGGKDVIAAQFVESYLRLGSAQRAYLELYPDTNQGTAKKYGEKMLKREDIKRELMATRDEAHELAIKQELFSLKDGYKQIQKHIEEARKAKQYSAVANMDKLLCDIAGHINKKIPLNQAGFNIVLNLAGGKIVDGNIEGQVIEAEIVEDDSSSSEGED